MSTKLIISPLFGLLIGTVAAHAQPTSAPAECGNLSGIKLHRQTIEEARRILSSAEAHCAFLEVGGGSPSRECAQIKQEANADPEKRRAWANAVPAWSYLDQLLLRVRAIEDRLGIECVPR